MRECEHECRRVRARMCECVCVKAGECTVCTFVHVCMYVCTCVCVCVRGVVAGPTLHIPSPPASPLLARFLTTEPPGKSELEV